MGHFRLGHGQTSRHSVIPLEADIHQRGFRRPLSDSSPRMRGQYLRVWNG